MTDKASAALQIAERIHSMAQEQDDPTLMIGGLRRFGMHLYWLGDFEARARIRDACRSDLALGERTAPYGRPPIIQPSTVCAIRRYPSGISERWPLAKRL